MSKWIIDESTVDVKHLEELERHYDLWWSLVGAVEKLKAPAGEDDKVKLKLKVDNAMVAKLEALQEEAYEAYTTLAGDLVHKADPHR